MTRRWDFRHAAFKASFIGIATCAFAFLIGFSVPAWRGSQGLWLDCHHRCLAIPTTGVPGWFGAVRGMECIALIAFFLCVVMELYHDFYSSCPTVDKRYVEICAFAAGFFGVLGVILFAIYSPGKQWGFALAAFSTSVAVILACVLAYFRPIRRPRHYASDSSSAPPGQAHFPGVGVQSGPGFGPSMGEAPPPYSECVNEGYNVDGVCQLQPAHSLAYWSAPKPENASQSWYLQSRIGQEPPPAYEAQPLSAPQQFRQPGQAQPQASSPAASQQPPPTSQIPAQPSQTPAPLPQSPARPAPSGRSHPQHTDPRVDSKDQETVPLQAQPHSQAGPAETVTSSVPVSFVTTQGRLVPVYDEGQARTSTDPTPAHSQPAAHDSVTPRIPAFYVMKQGRMIPVYSEEDAQDLTESERSATES